MSRLQASVTLQRPGSQTSSDIPSVFWPCFSQWFFWGRGRGGGELRERGVKLHASASSHDLIVLAV